MLSSSSDVRFLPVSAIQREDRIHIAACHHAAAQDILFGVLKSDHGSQEKRSAEQYSEYPYASLLMRQYARIIESFESCSDVTDSEQQVVEPMNKIEELDIDDCE
eukprot:1213484-Rhodomonas_salina.1